MPRAKKNHQDTITAALLAIAGDDLQTLARMAAERIVKLEAQLAEVSKGNG